MKRFIKYIAVVFVLAVLTAGNYSSINLNELTTSQRNSLNQVNTLPTGTVTSYATGDDGYYEHGRTLKPGQWDTLQSPNYWGNYIRFTNDKGGTNWTGADGSTAGYVVDNATGLGWDFNLQGGGGVTLAVAYDSAATFRLGSYTGFFVPNRNEAISLYETFTVLSYSPFGFSSSIGPAIWTSTPSTSSNTWVMYCKSANYIFQSLGRTATEPYLLARKHFQ